MRGIQALHQLSGNPAREVCSLKKHTTQGIQCFPDSLTKDEVQRRDEEANQERFMLWMRRELNRKIREEDLDYDDTF